MAVLIQKPNDNPKSECLGSGAYRLTEPGAMRMTEDGKARVLE